MNELFPIIRRKRRPLLPPDDVLVNDKVVSPKVAAGEDQLNRTDATDRTDDGAQAADENVPTSSESR